MAGFGPNTAEVEDFMDRIRDLDEGDTLALAAAFDDGDEDLRRSARRSLRFAAVRTGRDPALKAAQEAIGDWANSRTTLWPNVGGRGSLRADVARRVLPALADAAGALVMGGVISGRDFEALYGPFRSFDRR